MAEYFLDSGLKCTRPAKFKSDKEAWELLRALFGSHSVYVTMYKKRKIPINNPRVYVKAWNKCYSKKLKENTTHQNDYVPVMWGLTRHKWAFQTNNIQE